MTVKQKILSDAPIRANKDEPRAPHKNQPVSDFTALNEIARHDSAALTPQNVLGLQRTIGNRAVMQLLRSQDRSSRSALTQRIPNEQAKPQVAHFPQRQSVDSLIQRTVVPVSGGEFEDVEYRAEDGELGKGAFINLEFRPNGAIGEDGETISLVQTVKDATQRIDPTDNSDATLHPTTSQLGNRTLSADDAGVEADDVGTGIDQEVLNTGKDVVNVDPRYTEQRLGEDAPLNTTGTPGEMGSIHLYSARSAIKTGDKWSKAKLNDAPEISLKLPGHHWRTPKLAQVTGGMDFEVAALNNNSNEFIGSIKWGWKINNGHAVIDPAALTLADAGSATPRFFKAADKWNKTKIANENTGQLHDPMQLPVDQSKLGLDEPEPHGAEGDSSMLQDAINWVSENPGKTILGMTGAAMLGVLAYAFRMKK